ncbi:MAG: hypothetical protein FWG64_09170 [Firmicutes bacterium]|nr:hypothetical protein [Bacillota bacterium]
MGLPNAPRKIPMPPTTAEDFLPFYKQAKLTEFYVEYYYMKISKQIRLSVLIMQILPLLMIAVRSVSVELFVIIIFLQIVTLIYFFECIYKPELQREYGIKTLLHELKKLSLELETTFRKIRFDKLDDSDIVQITIQKKGEFRQICDLYFPQIAYEKWNTTCKSKAEYATKQYFLHYHGITFVEKAVFIDSSE